MNHWRILFYFFVISKIENLQGINIGCQKCVLNANTFCKSQIICGKLYMHLKSLGGKNEHIFFLSKDQNYKLYENSQKYFFGILERTSNKYVDIKYPGTLRNIKFFPYKTPLHTRDLIIPTSLCLLCQLQRIPKETNMIVIKLKCSFPG